MPDQNVESLLHRIELWSDHVPTYETLSGGLTNENYTVQANGNRYVLRIPGQGSEVMINRAFELFNSKAAARAGVSPQVLESLQPEDVLVIEYLEGEVMHPETVAANDRIIEKIGNALKRLQENAEFKNTTYVFDMIRRYVAMCKEVEALLPEDFDWMLQVMDAVEQAMERNKPPLSASHNDLLSENFIVDPRDRLWIIDWEYGGMNDPFFDLGDVAVEHPLSPKQEEKLLSAYAGRYEPEELARMRLHKLTADVWWGMWGMIQDKISALDFDFKAYGLHRFDRFRHNHAQGDTADLLDMV
jgi:thiamine kinase-like enzyme